MPKPRYAITPPKRLKVIPDLLVLKRFFSKTKPKPCPRKGLKGPCWIWQNGRCPDGYPLFWLNGAGPKRGQSIKAHRFSYAVFVGTIPEALEIDHRCLNRLCVNPNHLKKTTRLSNVRDSNSRRKNPVVLDPEFGPPPF